jgi:7-keto-8-aminopelargonate synthetase-like enzyme
MAIWRRNSSRPAQTARASSMIATDGVFSMDGYLANLPAITALASVTARW